MAPSLDPFVPSAYRKPTIAFKFFLEGPHAIRSGAGHQARLPTPRLLTIRAVAITVVPRW
jgi:hypothetical protein